MLSSKANAALARLKEIEEKYKIKHKEQKWKEVSVPRKERNKVYNMEISSLQNSFLVLENIKIIFSGPKN